MATSFSSQQSSTLLFIVHNLVVSAEIDLFCSTFSIKNVMLIEAFYKLLNISVDVQANKTTVVIASTVLHWWLNK